MSELEQLDIDYCAQRLANFVNQDQPHILGPHEIAYGVGWMPTISYWIGQRRVHLYEDVKSGTSMFAVEIAELSSSGSSTARRCHVTQISQIENILQRFLRENCPISALTEYKWIDDDKDADRCIPDPPNRVNSANFAGFVGGHTVNGGPGEVRHPKSRRVTLVDIFLLSLPVTGGVLALAAIYFAVVGFIQFMAWIFY